MDQTRALTLVRSVFRGHASAASHADTMADDEQQIHEALARHEWDVALTALMDAYGRRVYRYCLRMVKDADLAEDVLQETFVRAHQSLRSFRADSSLRTWLYAIAHNRCLDALKAERRRSQWIEPTDDPVESPDIAPGPEFQMRATEQAAALRRCLDRLSTPVKAAVLARHQEGMTYLEMSVALGARPAALERKVARALPVLRRCLERGGIQL
jgi:RNA polymerase sigma-70 factor, ECF subfamily